jgi:uncharacterized membrane protein YebE (DUF533 family)
MFDARDLLGRIMQSGMADKTNERLGHAMGPKGLAAGDSSVAALFKDLMAQSRGGLGGVTGTAEKWLGTAGRQVQSGNPLAIGGLAALAGSVLGGGRGALKGAIGGGALALLGSLAMQALKSRDQGGASSGDVAAGQAPIGLREPQTADEEAEVQDAAKLAVKAMISAAKADGEIDGDEISRILGKLKEDGESDEAQAFVIAEMQKPLDLDALVREVPSREVAVEVYAASLLAINVDTDAERDYLERLAARLDLGDETVAKIHATLGVTA